MAQNTHRTKCMLNFRFKRQLTTLNQPLEIRTHNVTYLQYCDDKLRSKQASNYHLDYT